MSRPPESLLVVGFGLLGGSVALATRRASPETRIAALDPQPEARAFAHRCGVEAMAAMPERVEHGLVVLCTPFDASLRALGDLAPRLSRPTRATDLVGLKGPLVRHARSLRGSYPHLRYVGAHPMTGSHLRGAGAARPDLFDGAPCALVAAEGAQNRAAFERGEDEAAVEGFWRSLGCRTTWMSAEAHDDRVAATSALPQLVASALAATVRAQAGGGEDLLAGPGLRDTTRLAASPPELWSGILTANRDAALAALRRFLQECERWERSLDSGRRESLEMLLEEGRVARRRLFPADSPPAD